MPTASGTELVTALSAFVASFLSGLLGIGGGVVLTPLLLYLPPALGIGALPVKIITGLTIVQAISGSVLGAFRHSTYGNVSTRLVLVMGPTGAAASLVGALVSRDVNDRALLGIFAVLALATAAMLLLPAEPQLATTDDLHLNVPLAVGISLALGFFGGMVGIGAIATIIGALVYLLRVPPRIAIGTSLGIGMFAAVAALIGKAATAQVDPPLATIVAVVALVASPIGAWVSIRTQPQLLMKILAAVVIVAALRMAASAVFG
ncbi:MAG TPA: sulfite exporter TauE/SafE family protein [Candidatus Limnocylindria bacterium]|nr:sulfite exporter TauE/SafE family protein [Candidatus Limnocylindria bacterium]